MRDCAPIGSCGEYDCDAWDCVVVDLGEIADRIDAMQRKLERVEALRERLVLNSHDAIRQCAPGAGALYNLLAADIADALEDQS